MSIKYKVITTSTGDYDASIKVEKYINEQLQETTQLVFTSYLNSWANFDDLFKIMYSQSSFSWVIEIISGIKDYSAGDKITWNYKNSIEISLFAQAYIYYLLQDSDGYVYTILNDTLTRIDELQVITPQSFIDYGTTTKPSSEMILTLTNPKILAWCEDEIPIISALVTATPFEQTVITDAIDLSNPNITGIENILIEYTGTPVFAISFNSGHTWEMNNGIDWVILTEENTGMQAETFEAITSEQWQERIEGLDSILVRFSLLDIDDSVTSVTINFTH